ncbi:hypothetical protein ACFL10_01775, partial [Patescibacteria group bacterium]
NAALDADLLAAEDELLGIGKPQKDQGGATKGKASKFHIPAVVKQEYPDLIPLILQTESMDDEEREYWFQILPIMTTDQVQKLREILVSEKQQLAKLDAEYEEELAKINEKHLAEWQTFEAQQEREKLEEKEVAHEEEEAAIEADLLDKLANL